MNVFLNNLFSKVILCCKIYFIIYYFIISICKICFMFPQNSCGFIERDDLRKFSFAFNAFYGIQAHLVPGVKVHFTVVKTMVSVCIFDVHKSQKSVNEALLIDLCPYFNCFWLSQGKEVATDVKVAPGGTEDIESTLYEGVVIGTLTDVSHITSFLFNDYSSALVLFCSVK